MLNFKQSGQKGGFWGAIASTLLPMALPLVAQGVGALVKKISGNGHGIPITCTKCQMDKIKQCGAGLRITSKSGQQAATRPLVQSKRCKHCTEAAS